jgi:undecaprenyl-phosphate 4-deoxy-4-formamido-L-arabinose transferase
MTSFRALKRHVVKSILAYPLNYTFIDGLLAWTTQRIGQTTVRHLPRRHGRSGYSARHLTRLALNLVTNFSLLPLRWISLCGFSCAALGLLTSGYYLIQYLLARITVPGYVSLMIAMLVLGGVQLMALGIMAEYLGRLHMNVNRKPQYVEREVLGDAGQRVAARRGRQRRPRSPQGRC